MVVAPPVKMPLVAGKPRIKFLTLGYP